MLEYALAKCEKFRLYLFILISMHVCHRVVKLMRIMHDGQERAGCTFHNLLSIQMKAFIFKQRIMHQISSQDQLIPEGKIR